MTQADRIVSSRRRRHLLATAALAPLAMLAASDAGAQNLGTFGVLAGSTVTNTGPTTINGNVGVSPGTAITGFSVGLGTVTPPYAIYRNDGVAAQAQSDLTTAYNVLANRPYTTDLTGQDLVGLTLTEGVYNFDSSAQLSGTVTLDAAGDPDAIFIFNIGTTLTTGSGSSVQLIGGAQAGNVYFRVGSSATLGAATTFQGKILALTSITLVTGATINCGAALARNGAVTLDTNTIGICPMAAGVIGDDLDETATENDDDVADAIDDFVADGGVLPLGFEVLGVLSPAELADALAQLTGEVGTGSAPTAIHAMDSFLDLVVNDRLGLRPAFPPRPRPDAAPRPNTVRVLGYGPVESPGVRKAFDALEPAAAPDRPWEIWAAGYGGVTETDADDARGRSERKESVYGLAGGIDFQVAPDTEIGLAVSGGKTEFDLSDGLGNGDSDMFQTAVFARTQFDAAYVAGALAYAYHDFSTDRYVTFAGDDHFTADFSGQDFAGHVEAGYRLGWFTPYGGLRGQIFETEDYSETTESGSSTYALDYEENTTTSARSELGARIGWASEFDDGGYVALQTRAAWAHDFGDGNSIDAGFQTLPGSSFTVDGAEADSDSLLFSAGAEVGSLSGFAVAATFDSEFAENSQTYGGTGRVSYRW